MRAMIRGAFVLSCFAIGLLTPRAAAAITLDQVVALAKAGVTDTVILALIDRDRTVFTIEPEQIVPLQREGLSDKVILAMLKSGRDEGDRAARADAAFNSAWIISNLATEPLTVTVGHGPDRPNTPHVDGFYSGPPAGGFFAAPWAGPSFRGRSNRRLAASPIGVQSPMLCYATTGMLNSMSRPIVTVCPEIMQPRALRR